MPRMPRVPSILALSRTFDADLRTHHIPDILTATTTIIVAAMVVAAMVVAAMIVVANVAVDQNDD